MADLLAFEKQLWQQGLKTVAGVDEAGRGPLAGPVVAACVVLDKNYPILGANDSKKLSAKKREQLYDEIMTCALSVSVGIVDNETIDQINILNATMLAMQQAISKACLPLDYILVDGNKTPGIDRCQAIVGGDGKSMSIACASIIAKVTRDRIMDEAAVLYPQYGFEKHKGYGTKLHTQMLIEHKNCPLHRRTFISKILPENEILRF